MEKSFSALYSNKYTIDCITKYRNEGFQENTIVQELENRNQNDIHSNWIRGLQTENNEDAFVHIKKEEECILSMICRFLVKKENLPSQTSINHSHSSKRSKQELGLQDKGQYNNLCEYIALGKECPYGSNCKFTHDVLLHYQQYPTDIAEHCPLTHGYCPQGMNCRWSRSHTDMETWKQIEKPKEDQRPYIEENQSLSLCRSLRKKKYTFEYDPSKQEINSHETGMAEAEFHPIDFRNKIYIAPLTTMGNLPFRRICVEMGADITCSEMALCGNLLKYQSSEWALLRRHPSEKIFGIQLTTGRVEDAGYVSELIRRELKADFVDFNVGCPIDAIGRAGAGAGLLMKVGRLKRIVTCMLHSLKNVPLMVKLRTGDHENTSHRLVPQLQALRGVDGNRVAAITIHGRTKVARYTHSADWDYIQQCSQSQRSDLPRMQVIGNGDVFDNEMYYHHLQKYKLDGIMIGRGALIKPWICTEIKENRHWDISAGERLEIIKKFCSFGLEHWGSDEQGVDRTRHFLLEWLSFLCRYVPYGLLERPQTINQRPFVYVGRSELETLLGSTQPSDWIRISEMFLGPVREGFSFLPKHKSNAYSYWFVS